MRAWMRVHMDNTYGNMSVIIKLSGYEGKV